MTPSDQTRLKIFEIADVSRTPGVRYFLSPSFVYKRVCFKFIYYNFVSFIF